MAIVRSTQIHKNTNGSEKQGKIYFGLFIHKVKVFFLLFNELYKVKITPNLYFGVKYKKLYLNPYK